MQEPARREGWWWRDGRRDDSSGTESAVRGAREIQALVESQLVIQAALCVLDVRLSWYSTLVER